MRVSRLSQLLVVVVFAGTAMAALVPGPIVNGGLSQPGIGDVNGDGLTDIVHDRTVLLNAGGGSFVEHDLGIREADLPNLNGGDVVRGLLDVNGDGRSDLLARDRPAASGGAPYSTVAWRVYIASENLDFGDGFDLGTNLYPYVVDANDDGRDDLVYHVPLFDGNTHLGDDLKVMLSNGDGTFTPRTQFHIPLDPQLIGVGRIPSADIDRDGHTDLVIRTKYDLVLLRGHGDGTFAAPESRFLPFEFFGGWTVAVADFDGDRNPDIAVADVRKVRLFLGDGTGRFPRFTSYSIPRLRDVPYPPSYESLYTLGRFPSELVVGEWIQKGREEIAAGTAEGDVVILAYEGGKLREVSRSQTEYMGTEIHAGAFLEAGKRALYMAWTFGLPPDRPEPRLFTADPVQSTAQPVPVGGRSRAVRGYVRQTSEFDVMIEGNCVPAGKERWSLTREGILGVERVEGRTVETTLEDSRILTFRMTVPWSSIPVIGSLEPAGHGTWEGKGLAQTACGTAEISLTAVPR